MTTETKTLDQNTYAILKEIEEWHKHGVAQMQNLLDHAQEGVQLEMGDDSEGNPVRMILNEETAKGLRVGVLVCISAISKLPFTMTVEENTDALPQAAEVPEQDS